MSCVSNGADALALLTSGNAARAAGEFLTNNPATPIYAVGSATASALYALSLPVTKTGSEGVEALVRVAVADGRVLEHPERAAGQLAYESKVAGMRQIDHVVARPDGSGLFAVQGNVGDPAAQRTFVDSRQAVSQSVEASTRQTEELDVQFNQRVQEQQQEQVRNRGL